jgi:ankyrin repeat protein
MWAARYNHPGVLQALIENGADIDIKDKNGRRALDYAKDNEKLKGTDAYNLLRGKALSE